MLTCLAGDAAQIRVQIEVLHHREIFIQTKFLRHIAEHGVQRAVVFDRIKANHRGTAAVGFQ
ncbi:Uncharacterised protein [Shigella flexneri]|nr:Uncharacterised protein [Shigella flexneri]